jgi:hypothetical protein
MLYYSFINLHVLSYSYSSIQILQLSDAIPGLGMDAVVQTLEVNKAATAGQGGVISMNNSAVFRW